MISNYAYYEDIRKTGERLAEEIQSNQMTGLQRVHNDPALEEEVERITKEHGSYVEKTRRLLKEARLKHYKTLEHIASVL